MAGPSLTEKLAKETIGNRKKAVILAILLIVGLSIWVPQMSQILSQRESFPVSSNASSTIVPPAESAGVVPRPEEQKYSWRIISEWIERNEFVKPARPRLNATSPFGEGPSTEEPAAVALHEILDSRQGEGEASESEELQSPTLLPAPSSLVLRSTMQGAVLRGAVINHRYYRIGETLDHANERYLVTHIEARRVILRCGEQLYELSIPSILPRSEYPAPARPSEPSANNL